jgi:homoserine dehydrogenase
MKPIRVGLLGCGTVGTGVARLLLEQADLIAERVGARIELRRIADIDLERDRGLRLPAGVMTRDARSVVADAEIDIVVEMIGGQTVARDLILAAIDAGKPVVTANKALLAAQGDEICRRADRQGVDLGFEASVGGCMPIIKSLRESLVGNRIRSMTGILNGTCNYILTRIAEDGSTFAEALAAAQVEGYAEADPTLDVEGFDTAHKITILAALAYGMRINLADVYVEGIRRLTPLDIRNAEEFGYRIKLLAISKDRDGSIEARVHPTMIPQDNILASVHGPVNAITVTGDASGDMMLMGRGAGMMPTASAVVSDIVDMARNRLSGVPRRVPLLGYQPERIRPIPVRSIATLRTHYYIRIMAADRPGVLSSVSGILGEHDISIKSVTQKGRQSTGPVPVVMLTHRAEEAAVQQALARITRLDVVAEPPMLIRIEDPNGSD